MKRREAIQNIFLLSAGLALLPNCQMEEKGPVYANVPLEKGQRTLMNLLTNAILPRADFCQIAQKQHCNLSKRAWRWLSFVTRCKNRHSCSYCKSNGRAN